MKNKLFGIIKPFNSDFDWKLCVPMKSGVFNLLIDELLDHIYPIFKWIFNNQCGHISMDMATCDVFNRKTSNTDSFLCLKCKSNPDSFET